MRCCSYQVEFQLICRKARLGERAWGVWWRRSLTAANLRETWLGNNKLGVGEQVALAHVDHRRCCERRVVVGDAGQAVAVEGLDEGAGGE